MAELDRTHRGRRSPLRLLAGAACLLLVVVGLLRPTGASWTADAEVDAGRLVSGRLDVTVAAGTGPDGTSVTAGALGVSDLLPGDSRAVQVTVRNASASAPFVFTVRGRATTTQLRDALRVRVWADATARTSGSSATGWTGSCDAGAPLAAETALGVTDASLSSSVVGPVAPGGTRGLCLRVSVPADAPTSAQGAAGRLVLTVDARSVRR